MVNARKILISGHRGYKALETENTWNAFKRAIKEGIDYVEFDVKMTKDGVPIVFHDENMHRLLGISKRISATTLAELQHHVHADGQPVLTLDDFLGLVAGRINLMLEIKAKNAERPVIQLLRSHDMESRVIVQSFNGMIIKRCHAIHPGLVYGLCLGPVGNAGPVGRWSGLNHVLATLTFQMLVRPFPVRYVNVDGPLVSDEFMNTCVAHGIRTILGAQKTWLYLDKIESWGVDIVNADNPRAIKTLLVERGCVVS